MSLKLAILIAVLPACTVLDANVGEVCATYHGVTLDIPAAAGMIETSFSVDDLSGFNDLTQLGADVSFERASVSATSALDLSFVTSAHIAVSAEALPRIGVYDCDGDCALTGSSLELTSTARANALAYATSSSLLVDLELAGATQAQTATVDVELCMSGHVGFAP